MKKKAKVIPLAPAAEKKPARHRYVRLFPERLLLLLHCLSATELRAYIYLLHEYVLKDGQLAADDKELARVARLKPEGWQVLRAKLIDVGIGKVVGKLWVDEDQAKNLEIQRAASERQRKRAEQRWGHGA